jgi:hypothetical protein
MASISETYNVDLNAVHDGNRVGMVVGLFGPQRVPEAGSEVVAFDNEGNTYTATVESVLPDRRIYLRLKLETKRLLVGPLSYTAHGFRPGREVAVNEG